MSYIFAAEHFGANSSDLEAWTQSAWTLLEEKKFAEAHAVFRGLSALCPTRIDYYRGLAVAAAGEGDVVTATSTLSKAIEVLTFDFDDDEAVDADAQLAALWTLQASMFYRFGRRQLALRCVDAARIYTSDADPLAKKIDADRTRAAKVVAQIDIGQRADNQSVWEAFTERAESLKDASLAQVLGFGDRELHVLFENGSALLAQGNPVRARRIFTGLISLDPDVPLFHLAEAAALEKLGRKMAAVQATSRAVRCARKMPSRRDILADALVQRAEIAWRSGNAEWSRKSIREALRLDREAVGPELRLRALRALERTGTPAKKYARADELELLRKQAATNEVPL